MNRFTALFLILLITASLAALEHAIPIQDNVPVTTNENPIDPALRLVRIDTPYLVFLKPGQLLNKCGSKRDYLLESMADSDSTFSSVLKDYIRYPEKFGLDNDTDLLFSQFSLNEKNYLMITMTHNEPRKFYKFMRDTAGFSPDASYRGMNYGVYRDEDASSVIAVKDQVVVLISELNDEEEPALYPEPLCRELIDRIHDMKTSMIHQTEMRKFIKRSMDIGISFNLKSLMDLQDEEELAELEEIGFFSEILTEEDNWVNMEIHFEKGRFLIRKDMIMGPLMTRMAHDMIKLVPRTNPNILQFAQSESLMWFLINADIPATDAWLKDMFRDNSEWLEFRSEMAKEIGIDDLDSFTRILGDRVFFSINAFNMMEFAPDLMFVVNLKDPAGLKKLFDRLASEKEDLVADTGFWTVKSASGATDNYFGIHDEYLMFSSSKPVLDDFLAGNTPDGLSPAQKKDAADHAFYASVNLDAIMNILIPLGQSFLFPNNPEMADKLDQFEQMNIRGMPQNRPEYGEFEILFKNKEDNSLEVLVQIFVDLVNM